VDWPIWIQEIARVAGYVGAVSFAVCPMPQLVKTYRTKDVRALSFWWNGEACMLFYAFIHTPTWPHFLNLGWSLFVTSLIVLLYIKYRRPRCESSR
jgi:uncharacterized protein with PQ loop repeat